MVLFSFCEKVITFTFIYKIDGYIYPPYRRDRDGGKMFFVREGSTTKRLWKFGNKTLNLLRTDSVQEKVVMLIARRPL